MNNKAVTIALAAALAAVLLGAAGLYRSLSAQEAPTPPQTQPQEQGIPAPDFTMLDAQGGSVAFSDYVGRPIVLNFWASWCVVCRSEMPVFDGMAREYAGEVDFMMLNLTDGGRETVERASRFIEEQGYAFPVFFDTLSEGAAAYSMRSIPATYFIDAEGNVRTHALGSMDEDRLRRGIKLILEQSA